MSDVAIFHEADLQKAAALYCEGFDPNDIADVMSIDVADVQRMIEHAEQAGHFVYRPRLMLERLLPEVNEFVYDETLTSALRAVLNDSQEASLLSLHISRSPAKMFQLYSTSAVNEYRNAEYLSLRACAARAADELCMRLFDGNDHTIGVNWGISVKLTIDGMRPLPSQLSEAKLAVISLFGDLDFHLDDESARRVEQKHVNCNTHVAQLAQRLGGRAEQVPLSVPGFIPAKFAKSAETFHDISSFLGSHASYREIFGELPGDDRSRPRKYSGIIDFVSDVRITKMDTIITGFGSADTYTEAFHFLKFWLDDHEISDLWRFCSEGKIVGDIAGHLEPSAIGESDDKAMKFLKHVNRRILAAQPSDFVDVACRRGRRVRSPRCSSTRIAHWRCSRS
jgi:DNA-binding transcriptional regulator LsrR (DeoR family)